MIHAYHRPQTLEEALELIANPDTRAVLMGGGTALDRFTSEPIAVVDLQDLGLNALRATSRTLEIGATVTLQTLYEDSQVQEDLKIAIYREASFNLRQVATIAGTLVAASGRSPFTTAMLALDASIYLQPGEERVPLGDLLLMRENGLHAKLISTITIPLNVRLAYEYVARTPADLPIVCAAVAVWPSGRTRVILGGTGWAPVLAMDGPEKDGAEVSAEDAYSHAADQWAAAEYRREMAKVLVGRCLSRLTI